MDRPPPRVPAALVLPVLLAAALPAYGALLHLSGGRVFPYFQDEAWDFREPGLSFAAAAGFRLRPGLHLMPTVDFLDFEGGHPTPEAYVAGGPRDYTYESENWRIVTIQAVGKQIVRAGREGRTAFFVTGGIGYFHLDVGDVVERGEEGTRVVWEAGTGAGLAYSFGAGFEVRLSNRWSGSLDLRHQVVMTGDDLDRYARPHTYETLRHMTVRLGLWVYL